MKISYKWLVELTGVDWPVEEVAEPLVVLVPPLGAETPRLLAGVPVGLLEELGHLRQRPLLATKRHGHGPADLAVLLLQFSTALLIGVEQQSFDNLINYQTGHAKVYADGYFELRDEFPLDYSWSDGGELLAVAAAVPGVAAATPRLTFQAQLSNGMDQIPCFGVGIQVRGSDNDVFRIPQSVVDGEYFAEDDEGILLGSGIAEIFEVTAGDWLTVLAKTQYGAYEALDLPIVGLIGTGNPLIDRNSFLLPLPTAQYILDCLG